jgi:acetyltransferase
LVYLRPVTTLPQHRYPFELVDVWHARNGERVLVRPVHPQDTEIACEFVRELSPASRYNRFHQPLGELTPAMAHWATHVDYERHFALIAEVFRDGREVEIGVARYVVTDTAESAEMAIAVADGWQRQGVGERLLCGLMQVAAQHGVRWMEADVLKPNVGMLALSRRLGFRVRRSSQDPLTVRVERLLAPDDAAPKRGATRRSLGFAWIGWLAARARA